MMEDISELVRKFRKPGGVVCCGCAEISGNAHDIFGRSSKSRDRVDASKMPCRGANKSHIYLHFFV